MCVPLNSPLSPFLPRRPDFYTLTEMYQFLPRRPHFYTLYGLRVYTGSMSTFSLLQEFLFRYPYYSYFITWMRPRVLDTSSIYDI